MPFRQIIEIIVIPRDMSPFTWVTVYLIYNIIWHMNGSRPSEFTFVEVKNATEV